MSFRFDIPLEKVNREGKPCIIKNNGSFIIAGNGELIEARNLSEAWSVLDEARAVYAVAEHKKNAVDIDVDVRPPRTKFSLTRSVLGEVSWHIERVMTPRGRRL